MKFYKRLWIQGDK